MTPLFRHLGGAIVASSGEEIPLTVALEYVATSRKRYEAAWRAGEIERAMFYWAAKESLDSAIVAASEWRRASGAAYKGQRP